MSRSPKLLDLSIELTSPPTPDTIAAIRLCCEPLGVNYHVGSLRNPLNADQWKELHWYLETYWKEFPRKRFIQCFKEKVENAEALLPSLGKMLYELVFGQEEAAGIYNRWLDSDAKVHQLTIKSDIPEVQRLPWELLRREKEHERYFLALDNRISLVRSPLNVPRKKKNNKFQLPLGILLVTARPGKDFVDAHIIARELFYELQELMMTGVVFVDVLQRPTLTELHRRLIDGPKIDILHFDGHGKFDEGRGETVILFENDDHSANAVTVEDLAAQLIGTNVRMVMMNACESSASAGQNALSNVVAGLTSRGINAAVGMSTHVLVSSAVLYMKAFYHDFSRRFSGPLAQGEARKALSTNKERSIFLKGNGRDCLAMRIRLDDWSVPHYYQSHPLELKITNRDEPLKSYVSVKMSDMPNEPPYGFRGRSREQLEIERYLVQNKLVVVYGFVGVGKTALIRDVSIWLTKIGWYNVLQYIDLRDEKEQVLLKIRDIHTIIEEEGKIRDTLLVVDSLESVLQGGSHPLSDQERADLWREFRDFSDKGGGVLLASSNRSISDDPSLMAGDKVRHISLNGLRPLDAYILALQVLESEKRESIVPSQDQELRDLLAYLDYHPILIQSVLPLLSEYRSFEELKENFSNMLLKIIIDKNPLISRRTLLDLLRGPLERLEGLNRALLPRLSFFEGGVCESNLVKIIDLGDAWGAWRDMLERVGLLITEKIEHNSLDIFIHFHPVLTPYLRSERRTRSQEQEYKKRRQSYIQHYYDWVKECYQPDKRDSNDTRVLLQQELPNLKHVLKLLFAEDEVAKAQDMGRIIRWFLKQNLFLEREQRMWEIDKLEQLYPGLAAKAAL